MMSPCSLMLILEVQLQHSLVFVPFWIGMGFRRVLLNFLCRKWLIFYFIAAPFVNVFHKTCSISCPSPIHLPILSVRLTLTALILHRQSTLLSQFFFLLWTPFKLLVELYQFSFIIIIMLVLHTLILVYFLMLHLWLSLPVLASSMPNLSLPV